MNDYKSLLASKTVWGGFLALFAGFAGIFGYSISPADQVQAVDAVASVASSIGGIVAIYGRVKATKVIGK
jgi:hypothetical protein